ncbi:L,D-transpeptidase family protein [Arhodomonas sp. AD133]|uniref:L,D-transpeptidase family protein n=1 Tax=Arhodomonas sp. AD133 TaxID=3415009 RepID=UPI003EB9C623
MIARLSLVVALVVGVMSSTHAVTFPLPPTDVDVVGHLEVERASADETLLDIGRRHGLGYEEMRIANPGVDLWVPGEGTEVMLPKRFVLPDAPREGVVLNVAEMRLYYYPDAGSGQARTVETYPVAIGRMDWNTPLGETRIIDKVRNPAWYPPESIRREAAAEGRHVPDVVPPGPNNPLGRFKMRLGIPGYLIHGTNRPWGVGMRVTHGCVRMLPEDIEQLFPRLGVNTPVRIVNQPVKAGWVAGQLYVEVHPVLDEEGGEGRAPSLDQALAAVGAAAGRGPGRVDYERLRAASRTPNGIPLLISRSE